MNDKKGNILSVNIGTEKGQKKQPVGSTKVIENFGLQGDAHAGAEKRQVSLLARESIEKIRVKGLDVEFGDFAENLVTEGIDLRDLPIGTRVKVGNEVILQISQIGKECHERCSIFYAVGDCVMPREGIFATVLKGGEVFEGDSIVKI